MNDEKRTTRHKAEMGGEPAPESATAEFPALEEQLAALRARGIISGGDGPPDSLKPTARVPGALKRFLASR